MTLYLIWQLTEFDSFPWFDTTNSCPFAWFDFLLNLTWLNIGFYGTSATGVACRQGTLTPSDTWSRPFWDLHMFNLLRPILSRTCRYFSVLCYSNIPWYFLDFAFNRKFHDNKVLNQSNTVCMMITLLCGILKGVGERAPPPPTFKSGGAQVGLWPPPHFWAEQMF